MSTEPLVRVRGLRVEHHRPWSWRPATVAVAGVDLDVHGGEVVGLVGESGCGKTSLVRAVCGLLPRAAGEVRLCGVDPARAGRPPAKAQLLVQDARAALNPRLSVEAWLAESARVHAGGEPAVVERALARYGLTGRRAALPAALSGGETRRVTLAALSIADPHVVFADEPTAGLDAARKAELLDLLTELRGPDRAIVMVTHDLLLARHACTRLVFLHAGHVVDDVPAHALSTVRSEPALRLCAAGGVLGAPPPPAPEGARSRA